MSHPRIEEVSDSDSDMSDPSEGDIADFAESDILRPISKPAAPSSSTSRPAQPQMVHPSQQQNAPQIQPSDIKDYQMLYPIYFDATRTRAQGRRVPASLAVKNPLAREIASACANLRLQPVFEAHRLHPKDWANPGRVRVKLSKQPPNTPFAVKNKHHLYILVARHLQQNPTTEHSDALRKVRVPGLGVPEDGEPWPRPAVPRGWKLGELLPAYSAAMTGGGVSENSFADMMKEMQGGGGDMMSMLGQGMGGMGGGGPGPGGAGGNDGGGKKGKKGKGKA
ncbi:Uu.00g064610.m01.CDS01 [Anthostomella pinea]|uniref:Uu.00g064610.m01.CDS01 n=1 Tax=Anthostomella pinea TaxID=933095 RepID=A0AAI8YN84_9PEZI|nr:Uu.00g064610.m01.CDS01 [Anthostomella pinea]